ncbi:MAG: hypothetical protein EBQ70_06995 [Betaproteobacteria bacterium]|nr:hypothetical protein [Betaproteobacteria bacterium]
MGLFISESFFTTTSKTIQGQTFVHHRH